MHHVTNVCQRFLCKGNLLRVIVLNVKTVCKALLQLRHLIGLVDNNKVVVVLVKGHPFELTTVSILKMIFKATIISLAKKDIEIQPGFEPGSSEFQSDAALQIKTPFNIIIVLLEDIFVFMRNFTRYFKNLALC